MGIRTFIAGVVVAVVAVLTGIAWASPNPADGTVTYRNTDCKVLVAEVILGMDGKPVKGDAILNVPIGEHMAMYNFSQTDGKNGLVQLGITGEIGRVNAGATCAASFDGNDVKPAAEFGVDASIISNPDTAGLNNAAVGIVANPAELDAATATARATVLGKRLTFYTTNPLTEFKPMFGVDAKPGKGYCIKAASDLSKIFIIKASKGISTDMGTITPEIGIEANPAGSLKDAKVRLGVSVVPK